MSKSLSMEEGTDVPMLQNSKECEEGSFALSSPESSSPLKMPWMQISVVCVSDPASLSLPLSSGFPPLRPAGAFFLKHESCPHACLAQTCHLSGG